MKLKLKRKRAKIKYDITAREPYHIRKLKYRIKDDFLNNYLRSDSSNTLLKSGEIFDTDLLEKERSRITRLLKITVIISFLAITFILKPIPH